MRALVLAVGLVLGASCGRATGLQSTDGGGTSPPPDAGSHLNPVLDAGLDAGHPADAGTDAGLDAGQPPDAGPQPIPDAGQDAGNEVDAGWDAGFDGGTDAGLDAGLDAGQPTDAGSEHPPDAGPDAGSDAGTTGTRYPIVLAHGFGVFANTAGQTFNLALGALQDAGFSTFADDTDAFNSTAACGVELLSTIRQVLATTGASKVNVIAHSMGGLDARYVASPGGLGEGQLIASITTIGTPHQGSEMADFTLDFSTLPGAAAAIGVFDSVIGIGDAGSANVNACLTSLSVAAAPAFNAATPDDPEVMYQSWAGVATIGGASSPDIATACQNKEYLDAGIVKPLEPILDPLAIIVGGENDGIVAVSSATYDTFRGCIPADHFGEAGGVVSGALPVPDPQTGFNYLEFYIGIARDLAAQGY